jgi:hypothetical protein
VGGSNVLRFVSVEASARSRSPGSRRDAMVRDLHAAAPSSHSHAGGNMWKKQDLETRVVILEAALAWVLHETRRAAKDPRAMERIGALASQVLEDETPVPMRSPTSMRRYNVEYEVESELRAG